MGNGIILNTGHSIQITDLVYSQWVRALSPGGKLTITVEPLYNDIPYYETACPRHYPAPAISMDVSVDMDWPRASYQVIQMPNGMDPRFHVLFEFTEAIQHLYTYNFLIKNGTILSMKGYLKIF